MGQFGISSAANCLLAFIGRFARDRQWDKRFPASNVGGRRDFAAH
jgi:hypothetical protein